MSEPPSAASLGSEGEGRAPTMSDTVAVEREPDSDHEHLQRLMTAWTLLADLAFSDLLLLVEDPGDPDELVVVGQIRPTTSQTMHREDLVGERVPVRAHPLAASALRSGSITEGERVPDVGGALLNPLAEPVRVVCIPVRRDGRVVGVVSREAPLAVGRRPGELERVYVGIADRLSTMLAEGSFPFAEDEGAFDDPPRVGDGILLLDAGARISFASPNAVSALHRLGVHSNVVGVTFDELGLSAPGVRRAFVHVHPAVDEVEHGVDAVVLLRTVPLLSGGRVNGGLVAVRDLSDLRIRDRLLLSKDATIREIHHRVKNNLQTISSLLSLQGRRLGPGEARDALVEAERRVRSIAVVHEILSREAGEHVPFDEAVAALARMAEDFGATERPVRIGILGHAGDVPADVATPLAVVLAELFQNAIEHAFPAQSTQQGAETELAIEVRLGVADGELVIEVRDNGVGLPEGFSLGSTESLGLTIVRGLVVDQLQGRLELCSNGGTIVKVAVPLPGTSGTGRLQRGTERS